MIISYAASTCKLSIQPEPKFSSIQNSCFLMMWLNDVRFTFSQEWLRLPSRKLGFPSALSDADIYYQHNEVPPGIIAALNYWTTCGLSRFHHGTATM